MSYFDQMDDRTVYAWVRAAPDAEPVTLRDGRTIPSVFNADLIDMRMIVVTDADRRPRVVQLTIGAPAEDDGATAITSESLRSINIKERLDEAVHMASKMTGRRHRFYDDDIVGTPPPVKRHDRRALTEDDVRRFVEQYRQTRGTMAERGKALGYSRSSVHRLLKAAVEDFRIITEQERIAL